MPVVTSIQQLDLITRAPIPISPGRAVQLEIPGMSETERLEWQRRLTRYYSSCGCKSGAVSLTLFLVAWILASWSGVMSLSARSGGVLLAGLLLASLFGKAVGIISGRMALRRSVRRLRKELLGRVGPT